jgi:RNA exonuclease NGL2
MTYEEILTPDADVLCLQEVDRLDKILPALDKTGYDHHYACGPRKKHGCLIAWKRALFSKRSAQTVYYDEVDVHDSGSQVYKKALSHRTKNIANMAALERTDNSGEGFVVATTHLFWHPS